MKSCNRLVALLVVLAGLGLAAPATAGPTCHGRFMNPITDICWSCVFPLTIGSATLFSDGQDDIGNPSTPVCYCSNPPRIGVSIGFWEPVRLVDVTRTPFCMVGLGGIFIEVMKDVVFAAAPVTEQDAVAMLQRLRGRAVLDGVRGQPAVDRAALARAISALSRFALAHPEVVELDLNPVFAGPGGTEAVDWLMIRG